MLLSLGEFSGSNLALDPKTVGAGFFVCTATIWAGTGVGSFYGAKILSNISLQVYKQNFELIHGQTK